MNKLVSKNPILRFKLGSKILFAKGGLPMVINNGGVPATKGGVPAVVSKVGRAGSFLGRVGSFLGRAAGPIGAYFIGSDLERRRQEIADKLNSGEYTYNSNGELVKSIAASGASVGSIISRIANRLTAIDKLLKTGNYISDENGNLVPYVPNNNSSQTPAASSPKPNYWWIKGFRNRVQELGLKSRDDVKAILRKLGVKADGIWGKNTEAAYVNKFKFNPDTSEEIIPMQEVLPVSVISNPTFITLDNPNFNWREALKLHYLNPFVTSAKQGGQLTSKNPVERFRNKNFI